MNQFLQTIILIESVAIHRTMTTAHITIFSIQIYLIKVIWFNKLVESVSIYETISTTHINMIETPILLREYVVFHRAINTTHITN